MYYKKKLLISLSKTNPLSDFLNIELKKWSKREHFWSAERNIKGDETTMSCISSHLKASDFMYVSIASFKLLRLNLTLKKKKTRWWLLKIPNGKSNSKTVKKRIFQSNQFTKTPKNVSIPKGSRISQLKCKNWNSPAFDSFFDSEIEYMLKVVCEVNLCVFYFECAELHGCSS